ncbi:transporter substrate-binding domain-containing protein [Streptomyces sp. NPDC057702]|uniref:bifunctional serine/threonine-protein kinase/glutamate ABC transporter substrate-binding protein n=1 Tax=unclassified Streptomyces TaxID=2593676 RepID=UPI003674AB89
MGRVIDDRFELVERLGGGGMGTVWRARDLALGRDVALKEVRPPDPSLAEHDPEEARQLRARVLREAQALARISHPNVATIYHIVDSAEHPYPWLVMELVPGENVAARLARGPLSPTEAASLGRGVLAGLVAVHAADIQHRDVKPANVLVRPDGRPVLTDFGIAAIQGSTALTAAGSMIGTPDYMAPERAQGLDGDAAADLWSLGMMLYVAVEGRHPMRRANTLATLAAIVGEDVPPPRRAGALAEPLRALLSRTPTARPDAAALDGLLAAVATGSTSSTPAGPAPAAPAESVTPSPAALAGSATPPPPAARTPATDASPTTDPGHPADQPASTPPARQAATPPPVATPAAAATPAPTDADSDYPLAPPAAKTPPPGPAASTPPPGSATPPGPGATPRPAPVAPAGSPPASTPAPPAYGPPTPVPSGPHVTSPQSPPPSRTPRRAALYAAGAGALALAGLLGYVLLPDSGSDKTAGDRPTQSRKPTTEPTSPTGESPAQAGDDNERDRKGTGKKISIGVKSDQPGLGFRAPDGSYAGLDVDVAKYVAKALGYAPADITWKEVRSSDRELSLASGEVEFVVATYTMNAAREQRVDFAGPYLTAHQDVLLPAGDTTVNDASNLNGKKVCTVTGSSPALNLQTVAPQAELVLYESYARCVDALAQGRVEAVTTDNAILAGYAASQPGAFRLGGLNLSNEPYGVGLAKRSPLTEKVEKALKRMKVDGAWDRAVRDNVPLLQP